MRDEIREKMPRIVVRLRGGLGNQLFQYAAARALAIRNQAALILDTKSGFVRDRVYRRTFSLGTLPIVASGAGLIDQLPFCFESFRNKVARSVRPLISERPWGIYVCETEARFLSEVRDLAIPPNIYLEGYWQSEQYFADQREILRDELVVRPPTDGKSLELADRMTSCDAVAVGVRLFEEVPGTDKSGVGGVVPESFYLDAADHIVRRLANPQFFVFCTTAAGVEGKLRLPGPIHYVTHDNGFVGEMRRLWLITQCRHHILSNSSFYWWGAWLAERRLGASEIVAADQFPNVDTVPKRWRLRGESQAFNPR
jgi:hypothetical protein